MKKPVQLIRIIFYFLLGFSTHTFAQNYTLESKGEIPQFFINSLSENYDIQKDIYDDFLSDKKEIKDLKEEMLLMSAMNNSFHFKNGKMLFGDDLSVYLNQIKNELLKDKPQLKNSINIYVLKSNIVNAYCTLEGQIYVSLGLIARASSEAELAFLVGHEISHYIKQHVMKGTESAYEIEQMKKKRKNLGVDDIYKIHFKRSQNQELEADAEGLNLVQKSIYNIDGAIKLFNTLVNSELPLYNDKFITDKFDNDYLKTPIAYTKKEISEINPDYFEKDVYRTHPNAGTRLKVANNAIANNPSGKLFHFKTKEQFNKLKLDAIYFQIRSNILARHYIEAYYDACSYSKQFPNSEKLQILKCKALYGIARYKNKNVLNYTTPGYLDIQGESQQLHYMFKTMLGKQVNTIAIKEIYSQYKSHKVPLLDSLIKDLLYDNLKEYDLTLDNYFNIADAETAFNNLYSKTSQDTTTNYKTQRNLYRNFYLLGLAKEKEDKEFLEIYSSAKLKYEKYLKWYNMDYKVKKAILKEKKKNPKLVHDKAKILIVSPEYFRYKKNFSKSAEATHNETIELENKLISNLKKINSKIDLLTITELKKGDVTTYNQASIAMDWINERFSHVRSVSAHPLLNDEISSSFLSEYDYVAKISLMNYAKGRLYYMVRVFDLNTGQVEYYHIKNIKDRSSVNELVNELIVDFKKF